MKIKHITTIIFFLTLCLLLANTITAQKKRLPGNGRVPYFVKLSTDFPNCIYLSINTRKLSERLVIEDVFVDVEFYDSQNEFIGEKRFLVAESNNSLESGKIHRWKDLIYPFPRASRIEVIGFSYQIRIKGTRPADPIQYYESEMDSTLDN